MHWPVCNSTLEDEKIQEVPLWHGWPFHRFGLLLAAVFSIVSVIISFYLIWRHATHYLKPWEQRHIIRVLFMVPIYSTVSFLSYYFYLHAIYFEVLRDCYEAFAIASFFALLCHYIAPDLHEQKNYFRALKPKPWVLPVSWFRRCCGGDHGIWRTPRSGLTWFNIIWLGVFQYCFVRVFMTIVSVVTQAMGRYCLESLNPAFAHIWVMLIEGACVTVAMFCLIQFYYQLRDDVAEHRPLVKIIAIKLVIFLSFWQSIAISILTSSGAIKTSPRIATADIKIGIPSLLLCIEMALFSLLHLIAFPWTEYDVRRSAIVAAESGPSFLMDPKTAYKGGTFGEKALMNAFNPWDLVKAVGRGFKWFAVGRKTREQDISYKNHAPPGAGLEPTRLDPGFQSPHPRPYDRLRDDDEQELLARAQSNPFADPDPFHARPWGPADGTGDIGSADLYGGRGDPRLGSALPAPGPGRRDYAGQELGVVDGAGGLHLANEDTGYHGAAVTPTLGVGRPHVGDGHGDGWDVWGGGVGTRGVGTGARGGEREGERVGREFDGENRF